MSASTLPNDRPANRPLDHACPQIGIAASRLPFGIVVWRFVAFMRSHPGFSAPYLLPLRVPVVPIACFVSLRQSDQLRAGAWGLSASLSGLLSLNKVSIHTTFDQLERWITVPPP